MGRPLAITVSCSVALVSPPRLASPGSRAFATRRHRLAHGTVLVRAQKTYRERLLPLPDEVGQAIVMYLRDGAHPPRAAKSS